MEKDAGFQAALTEARQGRDEGGVPIGAAFVDAHGHILGRGHNMRVQRSSNTLHVSEVDVGHLRDKLNPEGFTRLNIHNYIRMV